MNFIEDYNRDVSAALETVNLTKVQEAVDMFAEARDAGRWIFVCGNGGSASTASHLACDVGKGASLSNEKPFKIICLADFISKITAYANDISYESIFCEQVDRLAGKDDVVVAISGSGNSPNVVNAIEKANELGCKTIVLTGRDGGKLGKIAQLEIRVNEQHMGKIEDVHLIITHIIGYYFIDQPGK